MAKTRRGEKEKKDVKKSQTLPSSPTHSFSSSSSSDFEFTISLSPRKSSSHLCPADELFYKGQILPLHLSSRLSMVQTLLLTSPSTTSSSSESTSRDSSGSSNSSIASDLVLLSGFDSARPSSFTEEEEYKNELKSVKKPNNKYFSFSRFFSKNRDQEGTKKVNTSANTSAKEVMRKYLRKVKPLYEKLSQKKVKTIVENRGVGVGVECSVLKTTMKSSIGDSISNSFSGNQRYPRKKRCVSSCPSSMRSSPSRSYTVLNPQKSVGSTNSSSMEELQNAIQGAIAHCKNSMVQNNTLMVSKEI